MDDGSGEKNEWFESGLTVVTKFNGIGIAAVAGINAIGAAALSFFNSMGLVTIGVVNSIGLVTIGGVNSMGLVAIGGVKLHRPGRPRRGQQRGTHRHRRRVDHHPGLKGCGNAFVPSRFWVWHNCGHDQ